MTENVKQTSYGYEATWAKTDSYYSKIVGFNKPNKTSMHFHKVKNKSWFINDGNFKLNYIDTATGALFESNLKEGKQNISNNIEYGVSITDGCIDFESTQMLLNLLNK